MHGNYSCLQSVLKMAVALNQAHLVKRSLTQSLRYKRQFLMHIDYEMIEDAFELAYISRSFSTPCLTHSSRSAEDVKIEVVFGHASPQVQALIVEVTVAMAFGVNLEPASSGLSGAYFLCAQNGQTIAVVKPIDELPLRNSIRIGETGLRKSAAYLLDHDGFSGVPPTTVVKFPGQHCKIASLQRFVDHECDAGDLGPSGFSVASVHRIGILDVRLMNLDRHASNILVRQGKKGELVPIDHGFCLPESLDNPYFEWLHWPQASIPFEQAEVDYVSGLNPFKDAEMLRSKLPLISESSIRVLIVCIVFLKRAVGHGLCLADIGEMMTREFRGGEENWSFLEKLCLNAMDKLKAGISEGSSGLDNDRDYQIPRFSCSDVLDGSHRKCISFGDMEDEEWHLFLEIFDNILLTMAFEERKKHRLVEA